jgi:hypothetical protein
MKFVYHLSTHQYLSMSDLPYDAVTISARSPDTVRAEVATWQLAPGALPPTTNWTCSMSQSSLGFRLFRAEMTRSN